MPESLQSWWSMEKVYRGGIWLTNRFLQRKLRSGHVIYVKTLAIARGRLVHPKAQRSFYQYPLPFSLRSKAVPPPFLSHVLSFPPSLFWVSLYPISFRPSFPLLHAPLFLSLCFSLLFPSFSLSVTLFHTHRLSLWVHLSLTWERTHVPLHFIPLTVNPALHVQSNDPIVLLQIACRLQGQPPHSSMSIGGE